MRTEAAKERGWMESSSRVDGDGGLARGGLHGVLIPISHPARVVVDFSSRIGWRWKADIRSARFRLVTGPSPTQTAEGCGMWAVVCTSPGVCCHPSCPGFSHIWAYRERPLFGLGSKAKEILVRRVAFGLRFPFTITIFAKRPGHFRSIFIL